MTAGLATPQTFDFRGQVVRTVDMQGEPWFVAVDVCSVLDIDNSRQATSYLDDDERSVITNDGRPLTIVSEPGLFSLILRSRKPEAKAFKRWVTHEVLPAIRKTGHYGIDVQAIDRKTLAQWLIEAWLAAKRQEAKVSPARIDVTVSPRSAARRSRRSA